jgi:rhamnosyltransferase
VNGPSNVGAVIVTYNPDLERLALSLNSLVDQTSRVVIVDNGSKNLDELRALSARYSTVNILALEENRGIATGFNTGIAHLAKDGGLPSWVLTTDQDSVLHTGAIKAMLTSLQKLDEVTRRRCGILAAAWEVRRPSHRWLARRAATALNLGGIGEFQERLSVISSGNLVRRELLEEVSYQDDLFIDHVDSAFCAATRKRGWLVCESRALLMEHRVGTDIEYRGRERSYENVQRLYYMTRNSTYLLLRHDLPPSVYIASLIWWTRSYVAKHGSKSVLSCTLVLFVGAFDGTIRRLGRREYAFLTRELKRPAIR